jgi:hypothetical protein
MKVVLKTKISGKHGLHAAGETVEVPDAVGQKLIDRKHATAFSADSTTPPPAAPPATS